MMRVPALLGAVLLLTLTAQAHANLSRFCDGVNRSEGYCNVYRNYSGPPWAAYHSSFVDRGVFDKAVAVVIGISEYRSGYSDLSAPRHEAKHVERFLIDEAKFDLVVTLTDRAASKQRITELMSDLIPPQLTGKDRFLFYFSGHGDTRELPGGRKRGYLVTSDAREGRWSRMISMKTVQDWSLPIAEARQSLWLIDACFSGLANAQTMSRVPEYTRRRLSQRGHHLITAGLKDEESLIVNGRSLFTSAFLQAARQADQSIAGTGQDGIISLYEMQLHIGKVLDREIARLNADRLGNPFKMSPQMSVLHEDDGQFFFVNRSWNRQVELPSPRPYAPVDVERKSPQPEAERTWRGLGRSWIVDASGGGDTRTITEAIERARDGDIIRVRPGRYTEGLVIDKNLEIIGDGPRDRIVIEASNAIAIHFKAEQGHIAGLTVRNAGERKKAAVFITQGRLFLENNDIRSASLSAVEVKGAKANPVIRDNEIRDSKHSGIFVNEQGRGAIEANLFFGNTLPGVAIGEGADPIVRNNEIRDNKRSGILVFQQGRGTIEKNRIFNNGVTGIQIREEADPIIRDNEIRDNKQSGVLVEKQGRGTIDGNEILGNEFNGMEVRDGGHPLVRNNTITGNAIRAIRVHSGGRGSYLNNDLRGNQRGAWDIEPSAGDVTRRGNKG